MENQKISIIVPVYNAEKYLSECVLSILLQTYNNIELILVNDGSKDGSHEICLQYEQNNHVKYLLKENGGASSARNMGLRSATGRYVMFVDADDFIDTSMVEMLYTEMLKSNAQVACCGFKKYLNENNIIEYPVLDSSNKSTEETCQLILNELIGGRGCGSPFCKLYDLNIIRSNNIFFNESISNNEDVLFNLEYFMSISSAVFISNTPYFYRKGHESLSSGYIKDWRNLCTKIFEYKKTILGKELCKSKNLLLQYNWFSLNLIGVLNEFFCKKDGVTKRERRTNLKWHLNNIASIHSRPTVVYCAYDYPDRRTNFRKIYPLFAYCPIWTIKLLLNILLLIR